MSTTIIPATWMRGGTSKGLFLNSENLPQDPVARDKLLLAAIGSPDPYGKQIDGLGGATSSTSKIVLIKPSEKEGFDVDYTFGHIAIDQPLIDYSGNCGNLSAAVGVFAIEQGMVEVDPSRANLPDITPVRVWQTNLSQKMVIHVPTSDGQVLYEDQYSIAGIPNNGSPIKVEFIKPGTKNGTVLPTGHVTESLNLENGCQITASLINAGNATVFLTAESLGLIGTELPDEINSDTALLEKVEKIRCAAAVAMGLAQTVEQAEKQPGTPKLSFVSKAKTYQTTQGCSLEANEMDLCARIFSMGKLHHAFTGTGAIAIAIAASIPGTLVADILEKDEDDSEILHIGHSAGLIESSASVEKIDGHWIAHNASLLRTARTLMRGEVFIPDHYLT